MFLLVGGGDGVLSRGPNVPPSLDKSPALLLTAHMALAKSLCLPCLSFLNGTVGREKV